jgi:hypothetical protein
MQLLPRFLSGFFSSPLPLQAGKPFPSPKVRGAQTLDSSYKKHRHYYSRSLGSWLTNQLAVINPNRHQNSEKYYAKNQTDLVLLHNMPLMKTDS